MSRRENSRPKVKPPPKPTNLKFCRALYTFVGSEKDDELSFKTGDLLYIVDSTSDPDWWRARLKEKEGMIPANYVKKAGDSNSNEANPLLDACRRGNLDLLEDCLLMRVPVNAKDVTGNTALHYACQTGHLDCLKRLLDVPQLQLAPKNRDGDTPLHKAAWKGHARCVEALLEKGSAAAAVELTSVLNNDGLKPVDLANNDPETKAILLAKSGKRHSSVGTYDDEDYGQSEDSESESS